MTDSKHDETRRWFRELDLDHPAVQVLFAFATGTVEAEVPIEPPTTPSVVGGQAEIERPRGTIGRLWDRFTSRRQGVG